MYHSVDTELTILSIAIRIMQWASDLRPDLGCPRPTDQLWGRLPTHAELGSLAIIWHPMTPQLLKIYVYR